MDNDLEQLFCEMVPVRYDFLIKEFGFSFYQDHTWRFRAESPNCRIVMEYEKNHSACWIERIDDGSAGTEMYHGINVKLIAECKGYDSLASGPQFRSSRETIEREIDEYTMLLKEYCVNFLRGDFSEWALIVTCLKFQNDSRERKENLIVQARLHKEIREKAESAWKNKDFAQVVTLYTSIFDFLSPTEKKKVEYAKKQLHQ
ncbi:MAG: hypothetical protein FD147_435 [Chloroflexi bacterium]|nr:MAG: hypothetical protein FD147_435 [Chloroflexota bacterium]MBA4376259.1 hypothetical protein [Anaerolinea sp.]